MTLEHAAVNALPALPDVAAAARALDRNYGEPRFNGPARLAAWATLRAALDRLEGAS